MKVTGNMQATGNLSECIYAVLNAKQQRGKEKTFGFE